MAKGKKPRVRVYVRERRRLKRWNQEKLAEESGMSQEAISRLEAGRTDAPLSTLGAVAQALGCEPGDLLRHPAKPGPLISIIESLSPAEYETAARMLEGLRRR